VNETLRREMSCSLYARVRNANFDAPSEERDDLRKFLFEDILKYDDSFNAEALEKENLKNI
jgi:hypothetical protein